MQQNAELRQQIVAPLYEDKVVDYIIELAQVTEKPVSAEELRAALSKLDEDDEAKEEA